MNEIETTQPEQAETSVVPEGAVLTLSPPTETTETSEAKPTTPGAFMTPGKFMSILKNMVDTEQLTPEQARTMRQQFGITQTYFTGKKLSVEERRARRHRVKASRRINRHNGSSKGQSRSHGRGD